MNSGYTESLRPDVRLLAVVLLALAGCGDDGTALDASMDVPLADMGAADMGPEDVPRPEDGKTLDADTDAGAVVPDACANPADRVAIERTFVVGGDNLTLDEVGLTEGRECFLRGEMGGQFIECARDRIGSAIEGALSQGCLGCYASFMFCASTGDCWLSRPPSRKSRRGY